VLWEAFGKLMSAAEEVTQKESETRRKPRQRALARSD
jgi:hypothetical protein